MLRLEPFDKHCYKDLISWVKTEEDLMQFAGPAFTFPLTNEQLDTSLSDSKRVAFKVVNNNTNISIGHAEVYFAGQSACLGRILIGDMEERGKGLGQELVNLLLTFVFSITEITTAELNVFDWNIAAIKCYEKNGFTISPLKKMERRIKDRTWTALNMIIKKDTWVQVSVK